MDRSNRNRDRGGQNNRGRGGHDRGNRGNYHSGGRGSYNNRGGNRGGYNSSSQVVSRGHYADGNQGGRSGYTGPNAVNHTNINNNGTAPGRERASRWGDSNNSQVIQQPSQHQPTFVSQPPVQMPNMSNPPPGYPNNFGFPTQQSDDFRGGF